LRRNDVTFLANWSVLSDCLITKLLLQERREQYREIIAVILLSTHFLY